MAKYQIYGGRKREERGETFAGHLVRDSGQTAMRGEAKEVSVKVGKLGIPNFCYAWGIRLDKAGKVPAVPLTIEDDDYKGAIKFCKFGTRNEEGALMIRCRWIQGYNETIDKDYQDLRLGVKLMDGGFLETGEAIVLIMFNHGLNTFDDVSQKALVQMLKVHYMNDKSIYCDPDLDGSCMFTEVDQEKIDKEKTKGIDDKVACIMLVSEASKSPDSIRNLFDIVKGAGLEGVRKEDAGEIYTSLKYFADEQPEVFAQRVNTYKVNVSNVFEKAKSYEILDLTKDGFVAVEDAKKKKEIVLSDVPAKGEKMLDYMFDHFLDKDVYEGINRLQKITDKIK
jgi:hypothetical protein